MAVGSTGEQLRRQGVRELSPELAIAALQQALAGEDASVAIADVDWERFAPSFAAARRRPLLEDLPEARAALEQTGEDGCGTALAERLAGLDEASRRQALVEVVCAEAAAVLGHSSAAAVEPDRAFKELGFDSVTAVELRNRLSRMTGLRLPAVLVFDCPNPNSLARELATRIGPPSASPGEHAVDHLALVEAALPAIRDDAEASAAVRSRLQRLLSGLTNGDEPRKVDQELGDADDDELLAFIDTELA
jgi:acyl carrier protein